MVRFARAIKNLAAKIWSKSQIWRWPAVMRAQSATIAAMLAQQAELNAAIESERAHLVLQEGQLKDAARDALDRCMSAERTAEVFQCTAAQARGQLDETNLALRDTRLERDRLSEALSRSEHTAQSLETDLLRANLTIEKLEAELAHSKLDREAEKSNHDSTRAGLIRLLEWIHATHRLSAPPQGVRNVLQSLGRFRL